MKLTEHTIQNALFQRCIIERKHQIAASNIFMWRWESDFLSLTRNKTTFEFEIKISKQDFKRDALKFRNEHLKSSRPGGANYFVYVVPYMLIPEADIPSFAGLYYADPHSDKIHLIEVRKPPKLHMNQLTNDQIKKFSISLTYKYFNARIYEQNKNRMGGQHLESDTGLLTSQ